MDGEIERLLFVLFSIVLNSFPAAAAFNNGSLNLVKPFMVASNDLPILI
jgi:hypothetical protein